MDVFFDVFLQGAEKEERGTLVVIADEEDWQGSEDVVLNKGENVVTVKVALPSQPVFASHSRNYTKTRAVSYLQ